jgi:hypothetical protein
MLLRIYDLRDLSGRNAALHAVLGDWPERVCKQRGFTETRRLLTREATQAEIEAARSSSRLMSWRYNDLGALIDDETALGVDSCHIETLIRQGSTRARDTEKGAQ